MIAMPSELDSISVAEVLLAADEVLGDPAVLPDARAPGAAP